MSKDGSNIELLNEAIQKIVDYLKSNKPYLFQIDDLVNQLQNGELNITLRVYKGFIVIS